MKIIKTYIDDLLILKPRIFRDNRGYFYETYNKNEFIKNKLNYTFVQDNESKSSYGVIRGLHFQNGKYSQAKLVRVIQGKVLDVAVDLRKNSKTFGKYFAIELSATNKLQFLIPRGFAHGFSVLSKTAIFTYKCDNFYNKQSEGSINLFDKTLNIDWKINKKNAIVSEKDLNSPDFKNAKFNF